MRKLTIVVLCVITAVLAACSGTAVTAPEPSLTIQAATTPLPTPRPTPVPTVPAVTPEQTAAITAVIEVSDGDTLERDIIPQLTAAFSMSEEEVKKALAGAESSLIWKAKGFRRMEGIIVPGTYEVKGEDLNYWISKWIEESEQRYDRIAAGADEKNDLSPDKQLALASIVEWETALADSYENTVANVFLNRIRKNDTLGSCATVEYALGYQRPYLTSSDVRIESEYNTNKIKGLPPGPICCMDDESLAASIAVYRDKKLYYFFYDYVKKEIMSFTGYADFKAAAKDSKAFYESTIDSDRFVKIADKREYFATVG